MFGSQPKSVLVEAVNVDVIKKVVVDLLVLPSRGREAPHFL